MYSGIFSPHGRLYIANPHVINNRPLGMLLSDRSPSWRLTVGIGVVVAGTGVGVNAGEPQPIERHRTDARLIIGGNIL